MIEKTRISTYYENCLKEISVNILSENDETIIGTDEEELAEYYYQQYSLSPIEYDDSKETTWEHEKFIENIPAHKRESFYRSEGDLQIESEKINIEIPILPNEKIGVITSLSSSTYSWSFSEEEFNFYSDKITFTVQTKGYQFDYDEEEITQEVNSKIGQAKSIVDWKNKDIIFENPSLKENILKLIRDRKQKLNQDKEKISSLTKKINISLKKKQSPSDKKVIIAQKPIVKKIKPAPSLPEEYVLNNKIVLDIISFLDNQGKQFEKTPSSYKNFREEELRDILLVNLNSIYEGKATGETFSKKGKSDIYLNIEKGNILIFECKIWKGEKAYHSTIDQIRKYLTWRHNFGVIIVFVRSENFTSILKSVEKIITESNSYINGCRKIDETHFASNHSLENDEKTIELHHLFYNLFVK